MQKTNLWGGKKKEKKKGSGQRMSVKYCLYQLDQEPDQSTYDMYSAYCKVSVMLYALDLSSLRTSTFNKNNPLALQWEF